LIKFEYNGSFEEDSIIVRDIEYDENNNEIKRKKLYEIKVGRLDIYGISVTWIHPTRDNTSSGCNINSYKGYIDFVRDIIMSKGNGMVKFLSHDIHMEIVPDLFKYILQNLNITSSNIIKGDY